MDERSKIWAHFPEAVRRATAEAFARDGWMGHCGKLRVTDDEEHRDFCPLGYAMRLTDPAAPSYTEPEDYHVTGFLVEHGFLRVDERADPYEKRDEAAAFYRWADGETADRPSLEKLRRLLLDELAGVS